MYGIGQVQVMEILQMTKVNIGMNALNDLYITLDTA